MNVLRVYKDSLSIGDLVLVTEVSESFQRTGFIRKGDIAWVLEVRDKDSCHRTSNIGGFCASSNVCAQIMIDRNKHITWTCFCSIR